MPLPGEMTLRRLLAPMGAALADPDTREVVVNQPGRFGVENSAGWSWHDAPELDFDRLDAIGILAAGLTSQDFGVSTPACSSRLPDGERITMARPPVAATGSVTHTIRKRALSFTPTLEWLEQRGWFSFLPHAPAPFSGWAAWMRHKIAVEKATIFFTGVTGSSKTTAAEAALRAIPLDERIITVESVPEWMGLPHRNWVPRVYAQDEQKRPGMLGAEQVIEQALRERPDRILFGELRTGEVWAYLRALMSGHPGGISTAHAKPGYTALEDALVFMARQNRHSQGVPEETVRGLLRAHIDVVIHCEKAPGDPVPYRATSVEIVEK